MNLYPQAEWQHTTILNIPGDDVTKGDAVIEYSHKYEHDEAAGVQRVVVLVFEQKAKINTESMIRFDKVFILQYLALDIIIFDIHGLALDGFNLNTSSKTLYR